MPTRPVLLALAVLFAAQARAATPATVSVDAPVFQDHMVLQRDLPARIWGTGRPVDGELSVSVAGQTKTTTVRPDGSWRVDLDPLPAGGPHRLSIAGANTIAIADVLVGEVWVASGQSNMAREFVQPAARAGYPLVRFLRNQDWKDNPAETAWLLGKRLFDSQQVPVGIINRAFPGSMAREWLGDGVAQDLPPEVYVEVAPRAGSLYRPLIRPLAPYAIRGVFWWQGESDIHRTRVGTYEAQLAALVHSWRRAFERDDLPFIYVALPTGRGASGPRADHVRPPTILPLAPPEPRYGVVMYAAYLGVLRTLPFTGMAITKDLANGLHPRNRGAYAERMVLWARRMVYGEDVVHSGPIVDSVSAEGSRVRIRFRPGTADGLHGLPPQPAQGFALSEDGALFDWAQVEIDGSDVVVWNDRMPRPTRVRYEWHERSLWANLVNGHDMAAAPFDLDVARPETHVSGPSGSEG